MNDKPPKKGRPKNRRPRDAGALREIRGGFEGRVSRVVNGERERERFYGATRDDVLDQIAAWRKSPKRKMRSTPITVCEYLASWLADVKASNRYATYALREIALRKHIVPYLGELRLDALERDHVRGWLDTLAPRLRSACERGKSH